MSARFSGRCLLTRLEAVHLAAKMLGYSDVSVLEEGNRPGMYFIRASRKLGDEIRGKFLYLHLDLQDQTFTGDSDYFAEINRFVDCCVAQEIAMEARELYPTADVQVEDHSGGFSVSINVPEEQVLYAYS